MNICQNKSETVCPDQPENLQNCLIEMFLKPSIKILRNMNQYFSSNVEKYRQLALRFPCKVDYGVCAG